MPHLLDEEEQHRILGVMGRNYPAPTNLADITQGAVSKKIKINIAALYKKKLVSYAITPVMVDFNPAPNELHLTSKGVAFVNSEGL
ncbi:hypothetical protein E1162_03000 [Rhodobacteraceae bacterium RKSG542]|uniref:hypothetical protein n=1 Tax=Pseudovibrio flavus TaxID=2529854 RepID=UPI0012BD33A6|nr:hypothetical protein [Pseudovibrio flavus]MTI16203.1 hypothetical protein [Pseudovibrio flavus]